MTTLESVAISLRRTDLNDLCRRCKGELNIFHRQPRSTPEGGCCAEIVRRAAIPQPPAFEILIEVSEPLVKKHCYFKLQCTLQDSEDVFQTVSIRLEKRFFRHPTRFEARTFAQYRVFLRVTTTNVWRNIKRKEGRMIQAASLDAFLEEDEWEPPQPAKADLVEVRELYEQCLALLKKNSVQYEVIRHRYGLEESVAETAEALQMTPEDVRKHTESAMKKLRRNPGIQQALELRTKAKKGGHDDTSICE